MRSVSRQMPILLIRSGFSLLQGTGRMQHAFSLALFLDIRSFFVFLCSGHNRENRPAFTTEYC